MILGAIVLAAAVTVPTDLGARMAISAIDVYRAHVSPHLSGMVSCRFRPTCSIYGRASIEKYGLLRGGARTIKRIGRCGPWTKAGTIDLP